MTGGRLPRVTHRVGILVPSPNVTIETEYAAVLPESVVVHTGRLRLVAVDQEGCESQDRDVEMQAAGLGQARVDAILFTQTSASYLLGHDYDRAVQARIEAASGRPALTAAQTVDDALRAVGAKHVALASPFPNDANALSAAYLEESGFNVVGSAGLGVTDNYSISRIHREQVVEVGLRADRSEADAVVMPGGNMPCLGAVEELEQRLGKPVITTNAAGIWALLRRFGGYAGIEGFGVLLARHIA